MSRVASVSSEMEAIENLNGLVLLTEHDVERVLLVDGYIRVSLTNIPLDINKLIIDFYGLIGSNVKSVDSHRTVSRIRQVKLGNAMKVHFDENVLVHVVPHWDPSRTAPLCDPNELISETKPFFNTGCIICFLCRYICCCRCCR
eukprot:UN05790